MIWMRIKSRNEIARAGNFAGKVPVDPKVSEHRSLSVETAINNQRRKRQMLKTERNFLLRIMNS